MNIPAGALQRNNPELQPTRVGSSYFGKMIAFSLILHVIWSVMLLSPGKYSTHAPDVTFLDLKEVGFQEQAVPTPPVEQKAEKVVETQPQHQMAPSQESLSETERLQRDVQRSLDQSGSNPEALQERSIGLGLSNGYFSSIAEGESLRSEIREYYFTLLRELNEKWWLNKESRQGSVGGAVIQIVIARNGEIVEKKLIRRSGNRMLDQAMLKTLQDASPLPPLPQAYTQEYFSVPLKFIGPLNFFSLKMPPHSNSPSSSIRSSS